MATVTFRLSMTQCDYLRAMIARDKARIMAEARVARDTGDKDKTQVLSKLAFQVEELERALA